MHSSVSLFSRICPNDTYFYQACTTKWFETLHIGKSKLLCSLYLCQKDRRGEIPETSSINNDKHCDNKKDCLSGVDEQGCEVNRRKCSRNLNDPGGTAVKRLPNSRWCDGICDCPYACDDEAACSSYEYFYSCQNSTMIISPYNMCNVDIECEHGDDEASCPDAPEAYCTIEADVLNTGRIVLNNYTRCMPWTLCGNKLDQTNCTDTSLNRLRCTISGRLSYVSKFVICKKALNNGVYKLHKNISAICDDGIDNECLSVSTACYIHKHQLCDNITDCIHNEDEYHPICMDMMPRKCIRRFTATNQELPVPLRWIKDGVEDCDNGIDEVDGMWERCEYPTFIVYKNESRVCEDVFRCSSGEKPYIENRHMCDNIDTCPDETEMCKIAENSVYPPMVTVIDNDDSRRVAYCLPGLLRLRQRLLPCTIKKFPAYPILGTKRIRVYVPDQAVDCSYIYGEMYVYLSCTGKCIKASCPIRKELVYNDCPNQLSSKVYTLANSSFITFVRAHAGKFLVNSLFVCMNSRCVPYSQVCDLEDSCGDGSDEERCGNSFRCSNKYIPLSSVCDGVYDCSDLSDECDPQCGQTRVINSTILTVFCWIIAAVSIMPEHSGDDYQHKHI